MIRFILTLLYVILILIVSIPFLIVFGIIGLFNKHLKDVLSFRFVQFAFRIITFISGAKMTFIGKEKVPTDTAVLYVGNHRSYFDVIIPALCAIRPTGFIAKKEFKKFPIFNIWMIYLNCLFLDRKDIKQGLKTILTGIEYMKNGISMFIFPEGTRNKDDSSNINLLPFKEGSMKLATKSGCPIIPVAIYNTAAVFEKQAPKIKKAHVTVQFGDPIYPDTLSKEEQKFLGKYTSEIIHEMLSNIEKDYDYSC